MAEAPDGPPRRFRWRRSMHDIARFEGPERIAPEWWRPGHDERPTRDYYRLEDVRGRRFWVFRNGLRSEEHTSELQSLMRIPYAVFCLKKKQTKIHQSQILDITDRR